jgi:hypothetical protein
VLLDTQVELGEHAPVVGIVVDVPARRRGSPDSSDRRRFHFSIEVALHELLVVFRHDSP